MPSCIVAVTLAGSIRGLGSCVGEYLEADLRSAAVTRAAAGTRQQRHGHI
jgi:hypothetical protein